ncbi:DUF4279 domain-containing protein [Leptospira santarosai]|uniref:DUF4279 domain-containing protein n=1 Tax=Leptospira santarosai TaxID=28183 RepID=UPI000366907A|nr:DUF4279 domain-containing protein [Leptospira santarosai]
MKDELTPLSKKDHKQLFPLLEVENNILELYLCIDELNIDPNRITFHTKIKPHEVRIKGEKYIERNGRELFSKTSYWSFKKTFHNVLYPQKEIKKFINNYLEKHQTFFRRLFKNCKPRIEFVYYYHYSNNIGINFTKDIIKLLEKYGLSVDLDLYCLHEE